MKNQSVISELENVKQKIEVINERNKNLVKNIRSLSLVKDILYREYRVALCEVEHLETLKDIKGYKVYLTLKQNLETKKEEEKISLEKYDSEMLALVKEYSNLDISVVTKYITSLKQANSFKTQFLDIDSTKQELEKEKESNDKKLVGLNSKKNILQVKADSEMKVEEEIKQAKSEEKVVYEEIPPEIIQESMETCLD